MYAKLKEFFDYKPIFDEKEIDKMFEEEVKKPVIEYLWEKEGKMLQKAYDFAKKAHGDEKRLSWEPYIVHPVYVAKYFLMIKPWIIALQAALLHDVIEDTDVTWDDILKEFWPEVAFLCLGLEKVSKVRYQWEDRQIETLKKTFLAMWHDIRVIFIKLADRMHNIQTLKFHPKKEKQERIAQETLKIYAPIAKRLWIEVFQLYLENGAFAILEPREFERIKAYIDKNYSKVNVDKLIDKLKKLLSMNNIEFLEVKWRIKSPYRIFLKFEKYNTRNIDEIKDILAFRIIVKDIPTCYTTLWVIHSKYTPIIKRIKDYISLPKPNGYQSLHTTILGLYKTPIEIQIRTKEMDDLAEYWVAAHFVYKELWESKKISWKQIEWVNKLKEIAKQYQEKSDENKTFFNVLDVDFLRKSVFVYTPWGKVIELPKGWTVLDFAFRVHTDIWLKFKSAIVNGKIVSIDHKLKNGDIVEIKTFKNKYSVKKSWLDYVISPTSKNKIRQYLNHVEKEKNIVLWKEYLNEYLKKLNLPELFSKDDRISKDKTEEELNRLLIQINNKNLNPSKLIKEYYPELFSQKKETKPDNIIKDNIKEKVIIDNSSLFKYDFCPECKPKKWDKIIWKVTDDGIKIHKTTCKALKSVNFQKLVEAHWQNQEISPYDVDLIFNITEKTQNIVPILNILSQLNINVVSVNTVKKKDKDYLEIKTNIKIPTTLHIIKQKFNKEYKHLFNTLKIKFN